MTFHSVSKKIILSFVFLAVVVAVSCLLFYFHTVASSDIFFNIFSSGARVNKENSSIHLYGDKRVPLNMVLVRTYYVVAKDEKGFIIKNWQVLFRETLTKVRQFYEFQFAGDMKMGFKIYPHIIYSERNADYFRDLAVKDYEKELASPHSQSLLLKNIAEELKTKMNDSNKEWDLSTKTGDGVYVVNLIILAAGNNLPETRNGEVLGLNNEANSSLVFSAIFTNSKFEKCYGSVIAHEIGHGLGIPEFYVFYNDKVKTSGVMGEGLTRKLEHNYLDSQIKEKMESD